MLRILIAALAWTTGALAAQNGEPELRRYVNDLFAVDLPTSWREMTPEDAADLADQLPYMLKTAHRSAPLGTVLMVLGDVDSWKTKGFDGRALHVVSQRSVPAIDEEFLQMLRDHWSQNATPQRKVLTSQLTKIGPSSHPAAELRIDTMGPRVLSHLEFSTTTGKQWLNLSFCAWETEWSEAESGIRSMASSLTFPHPPRDPEQLSDRLVNAAITGGVIGLLLIVIRKKLRR